jgi:hypothetical protein
MDGFSWNVNLGNVISLIVLVIALLQFHRQSNVDTRNRDDKIRDEVGRQMATQAEKFDRAIAAQGDKAERALEAATTKRDAEIRDIYARLNSLPDIYVRKDDFARHADSVESRLTRMEKKIDHLTAILAQGNKALAE